MVIFLIYISNSHWCCLSRVSILLGFFVEVFYKKQIKLEVSHVIGAFRIGYFEEHFINAKSVYIVPPLHVVSWKLLNSDPYRRFDIVAESFCSCTTIAVKLRINAHPPFFLLWAASLTAQRWTTDRGSASPVPLCVPVCRLLVLFAGVCLPARKTSVDTQTDISSVRPVLLP